MEYKVRLDTFQGPLDLLLHLVKRHEVDVRDIPVARLAEQFLEYLEMARALDVEVAGEFVVMASTLMEIKSRELLPRDEPSDKAGEPPDTEDDPRRELVRQLVEYRKYKEAAGALGGYADRRSERLGRPPLPPPGGPAAPQVKPVEVWDLVAAFARLAREAEALAPTPLVVDDTPQHVYEERVRRRVTAGPAALPELLEAPVTKSQLIGVFLAILELIRRGKVTLEQEEEFGPIRVAASAGDR